MVLGQGREWVVSVPKANKQDFLCSNAVGFLTLDGNTGSTSLDEVTVLPPYSWRRGESQRVLALSKTRWRSALETVRMDASLR